MAQVEYALRAPVTNEELNRLFRNAWPGPREGAEFAPVLERSLGYVCGRKDGQLVGFVNVAWDGGSHAFLLDPIVRTDCQRRGIGRELVRRAAELAREAGTEWLHVDFEARLEGFYRQCGFRESRAGLIHLKETEKNRSRTSD
jgi:GNAT superfamily N-acetyltransferase